MVVALRTADLRAKKHPDRVVDVGKRHPLVAELIASGRVLPDLAVGGEHLVDPLVERPIGGDRTLHPVEVGLEEDIFLRPLCKPEDVGPEVVGMADGVGALEQVVDEVGPLGRRFRVEELHRLVERGNPSGEFQIDAADELGVIERSAACDSMPLPVLFEQTVDGSGGLCDLRPSRAVDRRHLHDRACGLLEHCRRKLDRRLLLSGPLRGPRGLRRTGRVGLGPDGQQRR